MKWMFIAVSILLLYSCLAKKKKQVTVDLNFTCAPVVYFDSLETVLFTNDKSDLGGETKGVDQIFSNGDRVYRKHLAKVNGHYFINNVEKKSYWMCIVEGKLHHANYTAFNRNINLSESTADTIKLDVCMEPNVRYVQ